MTADERRDELLRQLWRVTSTARRGFEPGRFDWAAYESYRHRNETTREWSTAAYWAGELGVTEKTIRGDLAALAADGLITRRRHPHGQRIKCTRAGWELAREIQARRTPKPVEARPPADQLPVHDRSITDLKIPVPRPQTKTREEQAVVHCTTDGPSTADVLALAGKRALPLREQRAYGDQERRIGQQIDEHRRYLRAGLGTLNQTPAGDVPYQIAEILAPEFPALAARYRHPWDGQICDLLEGVG